MKCSVEIMTDAFHGEKEKKNSACIYFKGALIILKAEETDSGLLGGIFLPFFLTFSSLPCPVSLMLFFFFKLKVEVGKMETILLILF